VERLRASGSGFQGEGEAIRIRLRSLSAPKVSRQAGVRVASPWYSQRSTRPSARKVRSVTAWSGS